MEPFLEIKKLSVRYRNTNRQAISNLDLKIYQGDVLAILGPSGCGKTTLLNVISGLIDSQNVDTTGEIKWGSVRPKIRNVFQLATLLPWRTAAKNIAFGLEAEHVPNETIERRVREALEMVGLTEYADNYPHQLSIGMQQRVNFARALVCEPDLLLLDEPFSALDEITKKEIQNEFLKIIKEKNITSIFVTHNVSEVSVLASKSIILSKDNHEALGVTFADSPKIDVEQKYFSQFEIYDE